MDQLEQLTQAVTDVTTAAQAEAGRVEAVIADLKAHPAAPDLSAQIAALETVATNLNAVEAPAPAPPTP